MTFFYLPFLDMMDNRPGIPLVYSLVKMNDTDRWHLAWFKKVKSEIRRTVAAQCSMFKCLECLFQNWNQAINLLPRLSEQLMYYCAHPLLNCGDLVRKK